MKIKKNKKPKYAVYKNINPESEDFGGVFSTLAPPDEKEGAIHGSNECVLVTDDFVLVLNMTETHGYPKEK